MDADLVLEGGGVKGVALVGAVQAFEDAGYRWRRIAGTSAGAVVGALVAAGYSAKELHDIMAENPLAQFRDPGLLDRVPLIGKALSIAFEKGIYEGKRLRTWLAGQLAAKGVRTFGDLRETGDPGSALPPHQSYRLVVTASDVSRGRLLRLPWDYPAYGLHPDRMMVADAVRASMSIPFFYEPVRLRGPALRDPVFLVDGGLLSNFPVWIFDRRDAQRPRWPTFGVKLSARPDALQVAHRIGGPISFTRALLGTMASAHDQMHVDDPCVQRRTVFVDTGKVRATDFDLKKEQQDALYGQGLTKAADFVRGWDFDGYVRDCRG